MAWGLSGPAKTDAAALAPIEARAGAEIEKPLGGGGGGGEGGAGGGDGGGGM